MKPENKKLFGWRSRYPGGDSSLYKTPDGDEIEVSCVTGVLYSAQDLAEIAEMGNPLDFVGEVTEWVRTTTHDRPNLSSLKGLLVALTGNDQDTRLQAMGLLAEHFPSLSPQEQKTALTALLNAVFYWWTEDQWFRTELIGLLSIMYCGLTPENKLLFLKGIYHWPRDLQVTKELRYIIQAQLGVAIRDGDPPSESAHLKENTTPKQLDVLRSLSTLGDPMDTPPRRYVDLVTAAQQALKEE